MNARDVTPTPRTLSAGACGVLLFAAALVAYFPALQAGFIWDDHPGHVTSPELQSLAGLARIWFEVGATQQYYPVLHSAFWLEHRLWGENAFAYHLLNVLLHATSACLVGFILRRLAVPGAWFAAALFTLHPVAVESVAWISEQKNTLSTVFYLAALLAFLRYDEDRTPRRYVVASLWFVLALLTKSVTATLPAALLVILWWRDGRLEWRRMCVPLLPWLGAGIGAGLLTAWVEHAQIGAHGTDFNLGPLDRLMLAGRSLLFYVGKLVWPADLIFIYPRWQIDAGDPGQWVFALVSVGTLATLWWFRRRQRGPLAGALFFAGTLFPALGFVNVFPFVYSYVADHFQYVASLGILTLAAAGATVATEHLSGWPRRSLAAAALALLGALTWRHAENFRDPFTLYHATLARNPECWMAHNNLAIALVEAGRPADALAHYEKAITLRPGYAEAENNYGYALNQLNRPADALTHLERALQLRPRYPEARNNLGAALMRLGRTGEGIAAFAEAIRLSPKYAVAHFNHGLALASTGQVAAAIPHFQRAVQLDPAYADAEMNWGIALTLTNGVSSALPHFERALALRPDHAQIHLNYGRALAVAGRFDEAVVRFREAIELNPTDGDAHLQLALALRQMGRTAEAESHGRTAQQLGAR